MSRRTRVYPAAYIRTCRQDTSRSPSRCSRKGSVSEAKRGTMKHEHDMRAVSRGMIGNDALPGKSARTRLFGRRPYKESHGVIGTLVSGASLTSALPPSHAWDAGFADTLGAGGLELVQTLGVQTVVRRTTTGSAARRCARCARRRARWRRRTACCTGCARAR